MSSNQSSDSPGRIVPLPEHEALKEEIEKLRTELSMLVLERDELIFVECKNIEMAYMLSVGALEYKAYELECAVLRLKRKADLIQARKNRQEKIQCSCRFSRQFCCLTSKTPFPVLTGYSRKQLPAW